MEGMKQRPKDGRKDVRSADLAIFHSDTLPRRDDASEHPSTYAGFLEQFPRHRDLGHLEDDVPCTRFEQTSLH
jgi:hypothetical protein